MLTPTLLGSVLLLGVPSHPTPAGLDPDTELSWQHETARYRIRLRDLRLRVQVAGSPPRLLARSCAALGPVGPVTTEGDRRRWRYPKTGFDVRVEMDGPRLQVEIRSDRVRTLPWPQVPLEAVRELRVPAFEGVTVRSTDAELMRWLARQGSMSATEALSMPFVGFDDGAHTHTILLPEPYYDSVQFDLEAKCARFAHEWTSNRLGSPYRVLFATQTSTALAAARAYRALLEARGELRTLSDKARRTPKLRKLPGALHAYLWGSALFSEHAVLRTRWNHVARSLREAAKKPDSFAKRLYDPMWLSERRLWDRLARLPLTPRHLRRKASTLLNRRLHELFMVDPDNPTRPASLRQKAELLRAISPDSFTEVDRWGDGLSDFLLGELRAAGIDRALLITGDLHDHRHCGILGTRPHESPFLLAPYDGYHSIHDTGTKLSETWDTAQFAEGLYETGAVLGLDGRHPVGSRGRGRRLSPIAAREHVERRVHETARYFDFDAWFVDRDGSGQFFDDAHPQHRATRVDDADARRARLRWLAEQENFVVGSDGGAAVMAGALHFGHGVLTPALERWSPVFENERSRGHDGDHDSPGQPDLFFREIPVPPACRRPYFDPRDRLPLYQAVFGDCLVTTHHRSSASRRFSGEHARRQLLELLYQNPPLYHLDRSSWQKQKAAILRHYRFWSPIHRVLATCPLIAFEHASPDRLVQRTTFRTAEGPVHLTANFASEARTSPKGTRLPALSLTVTGARSFPQMRFLAGRD